MGKTKLHEVYKCQVCGNMVEVIHSGAQALNCCGQPMKLLRENTTDAAKEKHVPVVEFSDGKVHVKVGSVAHPMEEDHFIEWIEVLAHGRTMRKFLKPGEAPEATFDIDTQSVSVREFCNKHGLWKYAKKECTKK